MRVIISTLCLVLLLVAGASAEYLGQFSDNLLLPDSTANPFGAGSLLGPFNVLSPYGNPFSDRSVSNPFATHAPRLYDSRGQYRGRLSDNIFDPDSISNPFGRYGNPFSPDSVNNPFGPGNPFDPNSPFNDFGGGLSIYGD